MKNKRIITIFVFFFSAIILSGCKKEIKDPNNDLNSNDFKKTGVSIMEMSYDIKTSRDYDLTSGDYSAYDLANMNPSSEKQHVSIKLYENGQMDMTIEKLNFDRKIFIPHKLSTDNNRQIVKTEIIGNTINFYNGSGTLLKSSTIELQNSMDLVIKIKEMSKKLSIDDMKLFKVNRLRINSHLNVEKKE